MADGRAAGVALLLCLGACTNASDDADAGTDAGCDAGVPPDDGSSPFAGRKIFFGASVLDTGNARRVALAQEAHMEWLSLQPHLIWFWIERPEGSYQWGSLDQQIAAIEALGMEPTIAIMPLNSFEAGAVDAMLAEVADIVASGQYPDAASAFIHLLRDRNGAHRYGLTIDDAPDGGSNQGKREALAKAVGEAVKRYGPQGHAALGLPFPVKNWHFVEEYPFDNEMRLVKTYVQTLPLIHEAIKREDATANVILPGLAGNFSRWFAWAESTDEHRYISDPRAGRASHVRLADGGVVSLVLTQPQMAQVVAPSLAAYKSMLALRQYYDVADIHLYEETETFIEGKLAWLAAMTGGKRVFVIEGGGPFKNLPGDDSDQGDPEYFGYYSEKEGAEFVVKLMVLSAAMGVERNHWGLGNGSGGYWGGPWRAMGLLTPEDERKASFHTYKQLWEVMQGFTSVATLSSGDVKLFRVDRPDGSAYVAWLCQAASFCASTVAGPQDLSAQVGARSLTLRHIVTASDAQGDPAGVLPDETVASTAVPLSPTPVFFW